VFLRIAATLPRPQRAGAPPAGDWQSAAAASWCVAYTIVQGMFEPDFGSFVKHEANLMPMLMLLVSAHVSRRRTMPGAAANAAG
jgi:hypothetical protein